ncbi:MAG: hypothetical protein V7607_2593 [Solirubrobacteraceae bacterium]
MLRVGCARVRGVCRSMSVPVTVQAAVLAYCGTCIVPLATMPLLALSLRALWLLPDWLEKWRRLLDHSRRDLDRHETSCWRTNGLCCACAKRASRHEISCSDSTPSR